MLEDLGVDELTLESAPPAPGLANGLLGCCAGFVLPVMKGFSLACAPLDRSGLAVTGTG